MRLVSFTTSLCVFFVACSACGVSHTKARSTELAEITDTVSYKSLGAIDGQQIIIRRLVDLGGKQCNIPEGYTLAFIGGSVKNGILKGNKTSIISSGNAFFDHVTVKGSWVVPEISSKFFKDLSYVNALRNVVALSNPEIQNRIVIEEGVYPVSVQRASETCIPVGSNTELVLNGTIRLEPNDFKSYYIVKIEGENVIVSGKGAIIGDKDHHAGSVGEWGMGIEFNGARNALVSGLTIKNCWGDCMYVGGDSRGITIEGCVLDNGRRQGISITRADRVIIRKCKIKNVGGTKPEYAIDIEPNKGCTVDNVIIENVEITNCVGGIVSTKGKKDIESKRIGTVVIRNSTVSALSKYPLSMKACEALTVESCTVTGNGLYSPVFISDSRNVVIRNNTIYMNNNSYMKRKDIPTEKKGGNPTIIPIDVVTAEQEVIADNSIVIY